MEQTYSRLASVITDGVRSGKEQTMKLIKLTTLEKRDLAIAADEVVSIEKEDYLDWELERKYDFRKQPTRIILKHHVFIVREDFETVYALLKGAEDERP